MSAATPIESTLTQEAASTSGSRGRWSSLVAMSLAIVVDGAEGSLINSLFPVIRAALGLDLGALGLFTSISRFASVVFAPFWGMMADRYGRKRILFIVTGIWGIWTALAGLAQDFTQLLVLYTIGVIGTVASGPITGGLVADLFGENERGKAYGTLRTIAGVAGFLTVPLIGQLANVENGWRYGMFIMGGLSILSGLLILVMVKDPQQRTPLNAPKSQRFALHDAIALFKIPTILLLAINLFFVTSVVLQAFLVTYFVEVRGWQTSQAVLLSAIYFFGFGISSLIGGLLGDLFNRRYGAKGRIILMQLYLLAFAFMSFIALQIDWGRGVELYGVLFLFGLIGSIGFSGSVLPMVAAVVPSHVTATAFAVLFSLIQGLISALLSLALGYLAEAYGFQTVMFWMVTVPYAINAVFWFIFYRAYPKDVAIQQAQMAES